MRNVSIAIPLFAAWRQLVEYRKQSGERLPSQKEMVEVFRHLAPQLLK